MSPSGPSRSYLRRPRQKFRAATRAGANGDSRSERLAFRFTSSIAATRRPLAFTGKIASRSGTCYVAIIEFVGFVADAEIEDLQAAFEGPLQQPFVQQPARRVTAPSPDSCAGIR